MMDWPKSLVVDIARKRSVVFIGGGVSMQSSNATGASPKSWKALLTAAVAQITGPNARKSEVKSLINAGDYLTSCDVLRDLLGKHAFYAFLTNELLTPNFQPAAIHDSIIQLQSRIYATPNFDKIFETRMASLPHSAVVVKNYFDPDVGAIARGTLPVVLKVHGTIDAPEQMIFTRADYSNARVKYNAFYSILESLAITHSFLFLGCGFNDPDIKLLLEDHAFSFGGLPPHVFVMRKGTLARSLVPAFERNLNIKILEYPGTYSNLKVMIDELVTEVNKVRADMQTHRSW
jgi:hypothetical protein